jgi:heat shock protein HtpX
MSIFYNNMKTAMLLAGLMALFVGVGSIWGTQGMIMALIFGGVMNFVAFFYSDTIALKAMRGQQVDERSAPQLYRMVDRLRRQANLPMPKVYICPHDAPNAFATGRSPKKSAVAVTEGCVRLLNDHELEGVIAHELAHIKHRDTLISTIAATIAGVLAFLAQWGFFLGGGRSEGANPLAVMGMVILAAVGAAVIKAMISRSREFAADAEGARIAGTPNGLMSALQKLEAYSKRIPLQQPNPAQNNLFIVEPFSGGAGRTLVNLFATHPPTEARVQALSKM